MDIVVDNLVQVFGEPPNQVLALDHVTHRFPSQRFSCILGPSGCGKSTMIQIIGGIERYSGGTVTVGSPAPDLGGSQLLGTIPSWFGSISICFLGARSSTTLLSAWKCKAWPSLSVTNARPG